jgi:hypothetical protein
VESRGRQTLAATRRLFELRTGEGQTSAYNVRDAAVEAAGDLVVSGYDSDPDLDMFIGRTEWEGECRVAAAVVPRLREALVAAFGEAPDTEEGLLDLLVKGFGGRLEGMTQLSEWLNAQGIPSSYRSD